MSQSGAKADIPQGVALLWAAMAEGNIQIGVVRERPDRPGRWEIDFGRRWEPRRLRSFRGAPFVSKHMAEAIRAYVHMETAKGRSLPDVLSELAPSASGISEIETMVRPWLKAFGQRVKIGDRQPRTLAERERWAATEGDANHFAWWYGRSIWEISTATLDEWSLWMATGRGLGAKTRWNVMSAFSAFLTWLEGQRRTFHKPKIPWPERDERLPEVLSLSERDRLLDAIRWEKRGIFLALSWCGLRPSEARVVPVRAWQGEWLHLTTGAKDRLTLGVRRGTKKRKEKVVPVEHPELRRWLEEFCSPERRISDPDGPLFANPDGKLDGWWSETALRRTWINARTKAGVPAIGLYEGTKHTTGTALAEAGETDETLASLFGHADQRSVKPYRRVRPTAVRSALRRLERGPGVDPKDKPHRKSLKNRKKMVEAAGIEPASAWLPASASTCVGSVRSRRFPSRCQERKCPDRLGSHPRMRSVSGRGPAS